LAATAACALAALVSGKVYGISFGGDSGLAAKDASSTTSAQETSITATTAATSSVSPAKPHGTSCQAGLPGPELVFIPAPVPYCIDAREVTQGEYGEFLSAAKSVLPAQPEECRWNERFEPIPHDSRLPNGETNDTPMQIGACPAGVFDPVARAGEAVRCVDWCDARAYCEWAGKRLCGTIGPKPAVDRTTLSRSATLTEFQYACTSGGTNAYPYGNDYIARKCADANALGLVTTWSGSAACTGTAAPFDRIRDLIGNVFEWTADCDESGNRCLLQGGFFPGDPGAPQSCARSGGYSYSHQTHEQDGVRCCADAVTP
jgi:formylglycine-generating enzyme required for sulfatase activity